MPFITTFDARGTFCESREVGSMRAEEEFAKAAIRMPANGAVYLTGREVTADQGPPEEWEVEKKVGG